MKKILLIVILLFFACEEKELEKIIDRHPNGEKKIVAIYKGEGIDEKIIKRYYYNSKGKIEKYENNEKSLTEYYIDGYLVKKKGRILTEGFSKLLLQDTVRSRLFFGQMIYPDSAQFLRAISTFDDDMRLYPNDPVGDDVWRSEIGWELTEEGHPPNNIKDNVALKMKYSTDYDPSTDKVRFIITESFFLRRSNQMKYNFYEVLLLRKHKYKDEWVIGFAKIPDLKTKRFNEKIHYREIVSDDLFSLNIGIRRYIRKGSPKSW